MGRDVAPRVGRAVLLAVLCLLVVSTLVLPVRDASFSAQTSNTGNSLSAAATFSTVLYLHNNPTPPVGNTNSQSPLPLSTTAPTGSTLYVYASDFDSGPGRYVEQGTGLGETNIRRVQIWTYPVTSTLTAGEGSRLDIWLAPQAYTAMKHVGVAVGLYDCNSGLSSCSLVTSNSSTGYPWPSTYAKLTVTLGTFSHSFAAGRTLMLKIANSATSDINLWVAYDTVSYPSAVTLA